MKKTRKGLVLAAIVLTSILSILSLARVVSNTASPDGAIDFHQFWYSGHFILQGSDPYSSFYAGTRPALPVTYLDGGIATASVAQPGLATAPANTAPIILLLSPFALLSWPLAKTLWMLCNLALTLLCPLLVLRLLPPDGRLTLSSKALIFLIFFGLLGTRNTIGNGQTTLLVFATMLGTVAVMKSKPALAGLLLGIALSKYSVALPVLLFALYQRRYRVVILSIGVQLVALLFIALVARSSVVSIVEAYVKFMGSQAESDGIHFAPLLWFAGLPAAVSGSLVTVLLGAALVLWARRLSGRPSGATGESSESFQLLGVLILWSLLAVYHRPYDSLVALVPIASLLLCTENPSVWRLTPPQVAAVTVLLVAFVVVLSGPGSVMSSLSSGWVLMLTRAVTVAFVAMTITLVWLLFKLRHPLASSIERGTEVVA